MKKLLFLIMVVIVVITISLKVNYKAHISLSFGNNIKSNYQYHYQDTRPKDITNDILDNIKISDRYLQNILVKADNIYIDLNGLLVNKNNFKDLNKLLEVMRKYTKEKITIILKDENNYDDYLLNKWIFKIKSNYDIMVER